MNAAEAKRTAQKRAIELKTERETAARKKQEAESKKWQEQRVAWHKQEKAWIAQCIHNAANDGKHGTDVWMSTSDKPEAAKEAAFLANFSFAPELKKIIAHFKKLGYKLEFRVEKKEHVDLSDISPSDNWFTYETILEIRW